MLYGKKGNCDTIKLTEDYSKLLDEVIKNEEQLSAKFSGNPELLALFRKHDDLLDHFRSETAIAHYIEGYKFGVLMGIEIAEQDN